MNGVANGMATIEFGSGLGVCQEETWVRFEGRVKDGQLNGPGLMTLKDGKVKEGFWRQNKELNFN